MMSLLFKARRIRGHYRHLPSGQTIFVSEHQDPREAAKQEFKSKRRKKIELTKQPKPKKQEELPEGKTLTKKEIYDQLNRPKKIDQALAYKVAMHTDQIKERFGSEDEFLEILTMDEVDRADAYDEEPKFQDKEGARKYYWEERGKQILTELKKQYGETSTHAKMYSTPTRSSKSFRGKTSSLLSGSVSKRSPTSDMLRDYYDSMATGEDDSQDTAFAKMVQEHGEGAALSAEDEASEIKMVDHLKPKDMPFISHVKEGIKFFGHQAEVLAKLNVLEKAIIDVDMGGGKGLILPMDAMNLMQQGKVKKPLIVVPAATLEQNAKKITEEYTEEGTYRVVTIDNEMIRKQYGGEVSRLVSEIETAPENTIFMASYDVFSQKDDSGVFSRAKALSNAGFDYIAADESHNIKNTGSDRFQGLSHFAKLKYKRLASGTFLSNNPSDVIGQLSFLYPHLTTSETKFMEKYGADEDESGVKWNPDKLKELREDLKDLGHISIRRSAWMHKLPERVETPSISTMSESMLNAHELALESALNSLRKESGESASIKKFLDGEGEDEEENLSPSVMVKLETLQGISDHPSELASWVDDPQKKHLFEWMDPEAVEAVRNLKNEVSSKAQDVYKKLTEHFADPSNSKFIVFCQRSASVEHIMNNMPPELKKMAMPFRAADKKKLPSFTEDDNGPKILVAVDASIKEGVNMQKANAMYRYDHHMSPGNQEQSYARIWRFGQDKPTKFHIGIMDQGLDVPKYARMISKLHTNLQVTSDMPNLSTEPAFKLSMKSIKANRSADILDPFFSLNNDMMQYQKEQNKEEAKKYGEPLDRTKRDDIKKARRNKVQVHLDTSISKRSSDAHVGHKITKMSAANKSKVRAIVSQGIQSGKTPEQIARVLKHNVQTKKEPKYRRWISVAITEMTNARGAGSMEWILSMYGSKAIVYRYVNYPCALCRRLFGNKSRPKQFKASRVPKAYWGAIHPNCKCSHWYVKGAPHFFKSLLYSIDKNEDLLLKAGQTEENKKKKKKKKIPTDFETTMRRINEISYTRTNFIVAQPPSM